MYNDKHLRSFVFFSRTGCLLPLLIICNLFFGWIFLKPKEWLIIETILLLLFMINGYVMTRKIISSASVRKKRSGVIDVEGEVVKDRLKLKH